MFLNVQRSVDFWPKTPSLNSATRDLSDKLFNITPKLSIPQPPRTIRYDGCKDLPKKPIQDMTHYRLL
uniref:Uncharacterized protein n=1 Tax=Megaselia scalaris TaxID=36166 RepID=T1GNI1_MEGSC